MARIGHNKKRCEKYKLSGARERNKQIKQERHKKRMERFAKRREEGKAYVYDKDKPASLKTEPGDGGKTEFQKWRSEMAKLDYEMKKADQEEKQKIWSASKKAKKKDSSPK